MYNFPCSKEYLGFTFMEWAESRYTESEFEEISDSLMYHCITAYRSMQLPVTCWLRLLSEEVTEVIT